MGLWLGLLAGLLVAVFKVMQTRREGSEPELAEWPPFQPPPASSSPEVEPMDASGPVTVADPVVEEAPPPPLARAAVKKAVKKAAKKAARAPAARAPAAKKTVKKAAKKAAAKRQPATPGRAWVEPDDGLCPSSHPIKAKLSSRLFHLPGMAFYNRTRADRCYADEESAVQDGLTRAKR